MPMDAVSVLIDPCRIFVPANIYHISVVILIRTPYIIMLPQNSTAGMKVIRKKKIGDQ